VLFNAKRMGWAGNTVYTEEKRTAYRVLVGKPTVEHTVYGMEKPKCTCRVYQNYNCGTECAQHRKNESTVHYIWSYMNMKTLMPASSTSHLPLNPLQNLSNEHS
jgi:hypothetical protein